MRFVFILFASLLLTSLAAADTVTLEWSPNSEPDLAGYRVFVREAGQGYDYNSPAWSGTETTCTINDILETKNYNFVVRAYDTEDYDSGNSNEVAYFKGTIPDGLPPGKPQTVTITITVTVP
jgi:hypothetical protein